MSESETGTSTITYGSNSPTTASLPSPGEGDLGNRRRRADRMIVASGDFQHAVDLAAGLARSNDTVLISGPSGCGRSHIARAFHGWSPQASGPLVEVRVKGLSEDEQIRTIFGDSQSSGRLAEAEGGILLILELDSLAPVARERIADALRTRQLRRGADPTPMPLRTRIIATSLSDGDWAFPAVAVKSIAVHGLAERKEDILPLAAHFLSEFAREEGVEPVGFTTDATNALLAESWPGNVRELRARVREAVRLAGTGAISVESLMLANEGEEVLSFKEAKRAFETRYVEGLLRRCSGNISRAARLAKKDRKDFYDVIRRTGVEPGQFRS